MKKITSMLLAIILIMGCMSITASATGTQFTDVSSDAFYYDAVYWAVENGITVGTGNNKFSPNDGCTRGQVVTFLWRTEGSPAPANANTGFTDVKSDAYYAKAVAWAVENNITVGTGANTFSPDATCTRGQIVTFLWRAKGSPAPASTNTGFRDVKSNAYYAEAVAWAVENNITKGTGANTFSPDATCTRGQVVTFLYRAMVDQNGSSETEPPATEPSVTEHQHNYKSVVTAPTCEEHGYTTYTCDCGDSYTADTTYPTGHAYKFVKTVEATVDTHGYTEYYCAKCDTTMQDDITPRLDHPDNGHEPTWDEWVCDENGSTRTCTTCNYTQVVDGSTSVAMPEVVELINEYRVEAGLAPLEYDWDAQELANIRADEIRFLFGHSRPNGKGFGSLFRPYKMSGENIAGQTTAQGAVTAWKWSATGHWDNAMRPDFTRAVVACNDSGIVMIFGRSEDSYVG